MNIKPIQTEYKGVLFRSRLEARWALFFDALGIAWEYEAEAFALRDGTGYLPDFWLPKFEGGIYAEVKPLGVGSDKAVEFVRESGNRVWLCDGAPEFKVTTLIEPARSYGESWPADPSGVDRIPVIPLADQAEGENRFFSSPDYEDADGYFDPSYAGQTFSRAVAAVRAHRFWNPVEAA